MANSCSRAYCSENAEVFDYIAMWTLLGINLDISNSYLRGKSYIENESSAAYLGKGTG